MEKLPEWEEAHLKVVGGRQKAHGDAGQITHWEPAKAT